MSAAAPVSRPRRLVGAIVLATLVAASPKLQAARTSTWVASPEELVRGKADGMALTGHGRLFLAPRLTELGGSQSPAGPVQVWAVVGDGVGNLYLGTGPEGQILRIEGSGEPRLHYTVDEPMVTALAVAPDGTLLAGTAPGGVIYRISRAGRGEAWVATDERYVWSLVATADGSVYAGTGEQGKILKIDSAGDADVLFDCDESHIVSLEVLPGGDLLAGGADRGLVYRVDAEGHALVLHDDELPEVVAVTADADGSVLAALVGAARPVSRRPALRLRLPDGVQVGSTDEAMGTLEESTGPTLRGIIEGLAAEGDEAEEQTLGRVVRIDADGVLTELWSSRRESPFCLTRDRLGRVLFGTGEPARLYRVETDGDVALLATLREAQLTGLLAAGRSVLLATSNPAAAYRLEDETGATGTFVSDPFDAGGPARWGAIRWRIDVPSGEPAESELSRRTEIYTRTGNSGEPDATWSAWSPALTNRAGSAVINPDGRFLQWRVRQIAGPGGMPRLHDVAVRYEPYNRPPRFEEFRVVAATGPRTEAQVFRWSVRDPDGDATEVRIEYRPLGAAGWAVAVGAPAQEGAGDLRPVDGVFAGELEWALGEIAEGEYEVRGVASDRAANPPGEGSESMGPRAERIIVDRTPPGMEIGVAADGTVRVRLEDSLSDLRGLELVSDGRTYFTLRPDDGVCDSRRESYRIKPEEVAAGQWLLRGSDTAGNVVERPIGPGSGTNLEE